MAKKYTIKNLKAGLNSTGGFSLVELIIVLSLLGLVLAGIYNFFFFGERSALRVQAEGEALQEARLVLFNMEHEIRQAAKPTKLSGLATGVELPAAVKAAKAVVIESGGSKMTVYSYINNEPKRITYRVSKVAGAGYSFMERSVDNPEVINPANWQTMVPRLVTGTGKDYFTLDGSKVFIQFFVQDEKKLLKNNLEVSAAYTVRGKGAMQ